MGHPFKEEIIQFEKAYNSRKRIGNVLGYRFRDQADKNSLRIALDSLIKAHKHTPHYKAGTNPNGSKFVSMFIPFEVDDGITAGICLEVQSEQDGTFLQIEIFNTCRQE